PLPPAPAVVSSRYATYFLSAPHLVAQSSHASANVSCEVRKETTYSFGESFGQPAPRLCQSPTPSPLGIHSRAISCADSLDEDSLSAAVRVGIANQQAPANTSPSTSRTVYRRIDEPFGNGGRTTPLSSRLTALR